MTINRRPPIRLEIPQPPLVVYVDEPLDRCVHCERGLMKTNESWSWRHMDGMVSCGQPYGKDKTEARPIPRDQIPEGDPPILQPWRRDDLDADLSG